MSKVFYFITITIGLTILMYLAGIPYAGSNTFLNWMGLNPTNSSADLSNPTIPTTNSSTFVIAVIAVFAVGATLGSIFSKESSLRAILATGILTTGVGAFVGILSFVKDIAQAEGQIWIYWFVFLILGVYIAGFVLSMLDWWGGTG